jgi:uncharacterized membrane protein YkoI
MGLLSRAGLATVAWLVMAAAQADVGRPDTANSAGEHARGGVVSEQDARRIEIDRFRTAPIALRDAMSLARNRHGGSRIVDASFDGEAAAATYRVRAARGEHLWEDFIDAESGQLVSTEASSVTGLQRSDRELLVRFGAVRQELSDAIVVAERNTGGRAISAGLMMEQGRLQFVIVCVAGSDLRQVMLEPPAPASARAKRSSNNKVPYE